MSTPRTRYAYATAVANSVTVRTGPKMRGTIYRDQKPLKLVVVQQQMVTFAYAALQSQDVW